MALTKRSVPELNWVFLLTTEVCCQNTYRPYRISMTPDGFEPSLSWMSPRRLCPWTTGSVFSEGDGVGLEPTGTRLRAPTEGWSRPDGFRYYLSKAAEAGIEPT